MKTFSIREALSAGWEAFKANLAVFITFGLVAFAIWAVEQIGIFIANGAGVLKPAILAFVTLGARIAQAWLQLALFRVALKAVDGQPVSADDLFRPVVPDFLSFLLASVLYGLIVFGGLLLLVVPGVIWAVRYGLYGLVVADQHADPVAALKRSAVLTQGVRWEVFVLGLAIFGVNLLGAMALGVGLVATIPVTAVAAARVYRQLSARAAARAPEAGMGRPAEVH